MSATMTGPGPVAAPPRPDLRAVSSPGIDSGPLPLSGPSRGPVAVRPPSLRAVPTPPRGTRPPEPRRDRQDSGAGVDEPDTEELDLAALLAAESQPPTTTSPGTGPGAALAHPTPGTTTVRPAESPRRPEMSTATGRHPSGRGAVGRGAADGGAVGRLTLAGSVAELGRLGLHLLLAALPLLAISAQVFGLVNMNISAGLLVLPLTAVMVGVSLLRPMSSDRIVVAGMAWGLLATIVYDGFRLDTVYLMGWWGDFIPKMGTWLINTDPSNLAEGAVAGYLWRYLGDGGGIGVVFFVLAAATGLRSLGPRVTVAAAVGFAVFPVWAGLIGTVALSSRGQSMMFPLTPTTITLSLIGHLIFGTVMGLGAVRCQALDTAWPWPPLLERLERRSESGAAVPWASIAATGIAARPAVSSAVPGPRDHTRRPRPAGDPASGPLSVPSVRAPGTGPLSGPPLPGPGRPRSGSGSLEVPSWPGASIRAVRGWPSSQQPALVGASAMGARGPR